MKITALRRMVLSVAGLMTLMAPLTATACTSFLLTGTDGYVYGRTMEFGVPLKSALLLVPRGFKSLGVGVDGKEGSGLNWTGKYAAAGANAFGMPVLVDGMNEAGMTGGLLNAPGTAVYQNTPLSESGNSIASYQMLTYALTNFATVEEAKAGFNKIQVNSSALAVYHGPVQVRMTLHDKNGKSIVVEYLKGKLVITDNPVGVMTNDPAFAWHLDNIGNYANLTNVECSSVVVNGVSFPPPSSGSGLARMPGDFLSPSRFIRALFLSKSAPKTLTVEQQVNTAWHILGSFDIPPGSITLPANNPYGGGKQGYELTEWTVVADTKNLIYYIKTFENQSIQKFDLKKANLTGQTVTMTPLVKEPTYQNLN